MTFIDLASLGCGRYEGDAHLYLIASALWGGGAGQPLAELWNLKKILKFRQYLPLGGGSEPKILAEL